MVICLVPPQKGLKKALERKALLRECNDRQRRAENRAEGEDLH